MAPPPPDGGNLAYAPIEGWPYPTESVERVRCTAGESAPVVNDTGYQIAPDTEGLFAVMPYDKLHDALIDLTSFERSALTTYLTLQTKTYEARVIRDQAIQMMRRETRSETATALGIADAEAYAVKTTAAFEHDRDGRSEALTALRTLTPHAYHLAQSLGVTRSPRKSAALLQELRNNQPVTVVSLGDLANVIQLIPHRPTQKTEPHTAQQTMGTRRLYDAVERLMDPPSPRAEPLITPLFSLQALDQITRHLADQAIPCAPVPEITQPRPVAFASEVGQLYRHVTALTPDLPAMQPSTRMHAPAKPVESDDAPTVAAKCREWLRYIAPTMLPGDGTLYTTTDDHIQLGDNEHEMALLRKGSITWPKLKIDPADQPMTSNTPKNIPYAPATSLQKYYEPQGNYRTPVSIERPKRWPHMYSPIDDRLPTTDPALATPLVDKLERGIKAGLRILAVAASLILPAQKVAMEQLPPVPQKKEKAIAAPRTPTAFEQAYDRLATIVPPHILGQARQRIHQDLQQDPAMRAIVREMQELRKVHTDWAVTRRHELAEQKERLEQAANAEYASIIRTADQRLTPISDADRQRFAKVLRSELEAVAPSLPVGGYAVIISKTSQVAVIAQKETISDSPETRMVITSMLPTGMLDAKTGIYTVSEIAHGSKHVGNSPETQRKFAIDELRGRITILSKKPHKDRVDQRKLEELHRQQDSSNALHTLNHNRWDIGSGATPRNAAQVDIQAVASTGARIELSSAGNTGTRIGTVEGLVIAYAAKNGAHVQVTNTPLPNKTPTPKPTPQASGIFLASR